MPKSLFVLFSCCLLLVSSAFSQVDPKLKEAIDCYASSGDHCEAKVEAVLHVTSSEMQDTTYLKWLKVQGQALADQGYLDAGITIAREAYKISSKLNDSAEMGRSILRLGAYHLYSGKLDSSLYYHKLSYAFYSDLKDSIRMGFGLLNIGMSQKELGNYPEAFESYARALKLYRSLGNEKYVARTFSEMASLSAMTGEVDKAIGYNKEAARFYKNHDDQHTYAYILTNLANDLIYTGRLDTAKELLEVAISIFDTEGGSYLLMNAEAQYGRIFYKKGEHDKAIEYFTRSNARATREAYPAQRAYNDGFLAKCYVELGAYQKAIHHAHRSFDYNEKMGFNEEYATALHELYQTYKAAGQSDSALMYHEKYFEVRDSLFNEERADQLNELKVKYETELKEERLNAQEADLKLLRARTENQTIRTIALSIGAMLLLVIAILIIRNQRVKMANQKALAHKKEQLHQSEIEKKEVLNERLRLKLDHKKRELTSQALLIAEKNEMLRSFKDQLEEISEKAEENTAMNSLVKKIERAETKGEDWDKFMRIFEDVHPVFAKNLQDNYPKITHNDLRLAALLKMNFLNKEIASILHISTDGLKKARYRLRKKLHLPSETNLQDFFTKM